MATKTKRIAVGANVRINVSHIESIAFLDSLESWHMKAEYYQESVAVVTGINDPNSGPFHFPKPVTYHIKFPNGHAATFSGDAIESL